MHVIQYIATKADNIDEAFRTVKGYLEAHLGSEDYPSDVWYDWFVTGGGRWSSSTDPYDDDYTDDVAHQSSPKFQEYLDTATRYKKEELTRYIQNARKINLKEILDLAEAGEEDYFKVGHQLYEIKQIYEMTLGVWNYNAYFFDTVNDTTVSKYMQESIDKGDTNWYIVPVDFHF